MSDARATATTSWDFNLRANLRLWPEAAPNIKALASCTGQVYDEVALVSQFPSRAEVKTPTDPRAVRNTFEVMAYAGLSFRDGGNVLRASALGACTFSFLGLGSTRGVATEANLTLLAGPMIRALSTVVEVQAIWTLMLQVGNRLSNEELNRAMARVASLGDVGPTALAIQEARVSGEPAAIGPRAYRPEEYGTEREADQRKAMNPHFLLAGGGGLFIEVVGDVYREIRAWAVPMISRAISDHLPVGHASTDEATVRLMSDRAGVPRDVRSRP